MALLTPSAARMRPASRYAARSRLGLELEPDVEAPAPALQDVEEVLPGHPGKAVAVEVTTLPRTWMSMSSQWAKARTISSWVSRSARAKCSRVASEKTTPNPKVSSGGSARRRSHRARDRPFHEGREVEPGRTPPMQTILNRRASLDPVNHAVGR